MSTAISQLRQDIQTELTTANQLLCLISLEIAQIKKFTSAGGEFDENVKYNALLLDHIANIQKIDLTKENMSPPIPMDLNLTNEQDQKVSDQEDDTLRDITNLEHSPI